MNCRIKNLLVLTTVMFLGVVPLASWSRKKQEAHVIHLRGDIDWVPGSAMHNDEMPKFHVYFGGRHVSSDHNGMYQLSVPEEEKEQMLTNLSLIICKRFVPEFERAQTIAGMKIQKAHKCKWYDLTREYDEKAQRNYWDWELRTGEKAPKDGDLLPSNAIIISMSGDRVARLAQDQLAKQITGHIILPRIFIETGKKSMRAAIKSDIESIASRKLNANQNPEIREQTGVTISVPAV